MNKVLLSKDIKSKFPILSCDKAVFSITGKTISCKSVAFETMADVEKFVDENAGKIVVFDQPNLFVPDLPGRDHDQFVLRYAQLPDFHGLITRLNEFLGSEGWQTATGKAWPVGLKTELHDYVSTP